MDALEPRLFLSGAPMPNAEPLAALAAPQTLTSSAPPYTPSQIQQAYTFNQVGADALGQPTDGSGQTIAIVDAYYDKTIASDVAAFDSQFGLPAFNAGGPTFTQKVQTSHNRLPSSNSGWSMETALDVEWAHAVAPQANIVLVEAYSASLGNLLSAVQTAAQQTGVVAVSMSWGSSEFSSESSYDSYFTTPANHIGGSGLPGGVTFVASSGDTGGQTIWPAASPNVLAVGGTSLTLNSDNSYNSETGWSGSGGGYSLYEKEPSYQSAIQSTGARSNPDVAYNADPNTGVYVYDAGTWYEVGGTSAGAPQWAALVALVDQQKAAGGKGSLGNTQVQDGLYQLAGATGTSADFHDITSGTAGSFSAGPGYDLVTGLGSPVADAAIPALVTATTNDPVPTSSGGSGGGGGHGQHKGGLHADISAVAEAASLASATTASATTASAAFFSSGPATPQLPNAAPSNLQPAVASAALWSDTAADGERYFLSEAVQALAAFPCSWEVSLDDLLDVRGTGVKRLAPATDDAAVGVAIAAPVAQFVESAAAVERARAVDACLSDPACGNVLDGAAADTAIPTSAEGSESGVPLIRGALFLGGMMAVLGRTPGGRSRLAPGDLQEATILPTTSKAFSMKRRWRVPGTLSDRK
ncbi:MAG TPA: S53 family peptidase [Pirellulales bacterium]|nr:S53 family peptidase [Pirellulales bacterium]